jgi:hypothetical protein
VPIKAKFTPAMAEFISRWVEKSLESGLYEMAPESCRFASRIHLAHKEGPPGHERTHSEQLLRPSNHHVAVNEQIQKIPSLYPILHDQIERFNDCDFFFETDGQLAVGWRDILALRTPQGFLIRPTRLQEGFTNSGAVMHGRISKVIARLPQDVRRDLSNDMDDINGGVRSKVELVRMVAEVLQISSDAQFSLTACETKIQFGFPTAYFTGFEVGRGCRLTEKHSEPLIQM